jgi:hypothetical protein
VREFPTDGVFDEFVCEEKHEIEACYYCGVPADSIDHVTPKTIANRIAEVEIEPTRIFTVPSCRECNVLLGPKWYPTLTARKLALKDLLRKRYRKLLDCPDWHEDEILKLGPTLESHIRKQVKLKIFIRDRIRW